MTTWGDGKAKRWAHTKKRSFIQKERKKKDIGLSEGTKTKKNITKKIQRMKYKRRRRRS